LTLADLTREGLIGWPDIAVFGLCMTGLGARFGVSLGRLLERTDATLRRRQ
jgi:hypothetical protein